jgi:hypothetical protein
MIAASATSPDQQDRENNSNGADDSHHDLQEVNVGWRHKRELKQCGGLLQGECRVLHTSQQKQAHCLLPRGRRETHFQQIGKIVPL